MDQDDGRQRPRPIGGRNLAMLCLILSAGGVVGSGVAAQNFTTAAEVRPILQATRATWVALREYDGNDLLYFTHLEAWRCGLSEVRFSVNSAAAGQVWATEVCHDGEAQPNAMKMEDGRLPYLTLPLGAVTTVSVVITYDDGLEERADFDRASILMP